jgi:hypothetical protein
MLSNSFRYRPLVSSNDAKMSCEAAPILDMHCGVFQNNSM